MKILGVSSVEGREMLYLKPDSSLLVNKKPFFLPDEGMSFVAQPCVVIRINRLGKTVARKFASRYYSEAALGFNIRVADNCFNESSARFNMLQMLAFDYSAVVGEFVAVETLAAHGLSFAVTTISGVKSKRQVSWQQLVTAVDDAIERISSYLTLRMGDMVCVDFSGEQIVLERELVLSASVGQEQNVYCKIK